MIELREGNLLEADVEALVNTVNTVGVMGKGIALMFKEAYPRNFDLYAEACAKGEVNIGRVFVTATNSFVGPKWIINFPTKTHWRSKTQLAWIEEGLTDLRRVLLEKKITSIAIPPLGCGNGGLDWADVRPRIMHMLRSLEDVSAIVYEPTTQYQNVQKKAGVRMLTPARALISEIVRIYGVLGIGCTILEIQKLAWVLSRMISAYSQAEDPLKLDFSPNRYGPYSDKLRHLLNSLDGSYLRCSKRLSDAGPSDFIWFEYDNRETVDLYLKTECKEYLDALKRTAQAIRGFESPLAMEVLATTDWLINRQHTPPNLPEVKKGISEWMPDDPSAGARKLRIFDDRLLSMALGQVRDHMPETASSVV